MTNLLLVLFLAGSFAAGAPTPATAESAFTPFAQDRATDATIKTEVEQRLAKKGLTDGNAIEVVVDDHMVSLEGFVQSLKQKRRATKAAMKAKSVAHVMNHLMVARGSATDQEIAEKVARKIRSHPFYDIYDWIEFRVEDGMVTLYGWVREPWRGRDYEKRVEQVVGVTSIGNNIGVLPTSIFDDELRIAATRRIYGSPNFVRYASRTFPPIHIIVKNGTIMLEGFVGTKVEQRLARTVLIGLNSLGVVNNLKVDTSG